VWVSHRQRYMNWTCCQQWKPLQAMGNVTCRQCCMPSHAQWRQTADPQTHRAKWGKGYLLATYMETSTTIQTYSHELTERWEYFCKVHSSLIGYKNVSLAFMRHVILLHRSQTSVIQIFLSQFSWGPILLWDSSLISLLKKKMRLITSSHCLCTRQRLSINLCNPLYF
jgi:hypothetical protein